MVVYEEHERDVCYGDDDDDGIDEGRDEEGEGQR